MTHVWEDLLPELIVVGIGKPMRALDEWWPIRTRDYSPKPLPGEDGSEHSVAFQRALQDEILPFAEPEGIGVIVYSPMASGMLSGKMTRERIADMPENDWRKRSARFQEPELTRNLELVGRLEDVGGRHGVTAGAVAVAWTLRNPAVDGAIVGFRRPDQVEPMITAAGLELSDEDVAEIEG